MFSFKSNKDNSEYIMINVDKGLSHLTFLEQCEIIKIPDNVYEEINDINRVIDSTLTRRSFGYNINEIAIRKDSLLGEYLINNADDVNIKNEDLYISYDKVVNALNIAMFENNCKMSNKVLPLFHSQTFGTKTELSASYQEEILNYILNNNDFNLYRERLNGEYKEKACIIYTDGILMRRMLSEERQKIFKKA